MKTRNLDVEPAGRIFTALRMRGPIPVRPASDKECFRLFIIIDEARLITSGGSSDIATAFVNEPLKRQIKPALWMNALERYLKTYMDLSILADVPVKE
jgi:hypothetical protein